MLLEFMGRQIYISSSIINYLKWLNLQELGTLIQEEVWNCSQPRHINSIDLLGKFWCLAWVLILVDFGQNHELWYCIPLDIYVFLKLLYIAERLAVYYETVHSKSKYKLCVKNEARHILYQIRRSKMYIRHQILNKANVIRQIESKVYIIHQICKRNACAICKKIMKLGV